MHVRTSFFSLQKQNSQGRSISGEVLGETAGCGRNDIHSSVLLLLEAISIFPAACSAAPLVLVVLAADVTRLQLSLSARCAKEPEQKHVYTGRIQPWFAYHLVRQPLVAKRAVRYDYTFSNNQLANPSTSKARKASATTNRTCNRRSCVFPYVQERIGTVCTVPASWHTAVPK